MAMGCLFRLLRWLFFLGIIVFIIHWWVSTKEYMFSEQAIASVAKKYVGQDIRVSQKAIHREMLAKYPGHILPEQDLQWIFVNAGGWMGSMCLMHASLTEYVLLFGSAVDTVGHSGRYWANISDTILTGTFRQWKEGDLVVSIHKPGETVMHAWGEATSVNFAAGTWMLEYGRGFIPSTMGFALADTIFSTQDMMTLYYTFRIYIKAMALEASHYLVQFRDYLEQQF